MGVIKDSFTFDDVTLVPQYSTVLPSEAITISKLSSNLNLQIPLMSAAMDTVTESKMAIAISKSGGIGVVHRNLSIEKQVIEVQKAKKQGYKMTMKQLKKWKVKYHKLIFGKPSFDLFVDDKALFFKDNWYKFIDKDLIVK